MRIVVVEDEYRTRSGVVKLIQKISPDYEVAGEAENGLEGIEVIARCRPDLVIVDIKMPEMDGIEMLSRLKERGIRHKTVILSGYSDFEYAQKAIKIGVCEYLLKPITAIDLEQTLAGVEKEIDMEKALGSNQPEILKTLEHILQNLVLNESEPNSELYQYLEEQYGIDPKAEFGALILYTGACSAEDRYRIKKAVEARLEKEPDVRFCIFELVLHRELVLLLYNCSDLAALERNFQNFILREVQREGMHGQAFGWIPFKGLENFRNSLHTLRKELKWSIVLGEDVLISYPKTLQLHTRLVQYPIDLETGAKAAIFASDGVRLKRLFDDFLGWWRRELYPPSGVMEAFIRFASAVIGSIREIDHELYEQIDQKSTLQRIMDSVTWEELRSALIGILDKILSHNGKRTPAVGLSVKKALSLVDEFYRDGITLEGIAAKLHITPEYLGSLFNKEMGVNFSAYMKEYRILKAKELLVARNLKTYEVAGLVGYPDPKYFSRVFKEVTGMTPGEYQKAHK